MPIVEISIADISVLPIAVIVKNMIGKYLTLQYTVVMKHYKQRYPGNTTITQHCLPEAPNEGECHACPFVIFLSNSVFGIPQYNKKGKRKVQRVPQSQTAALSRHQKEEETDKTKQAQIEQMYEKH